jgi:hypothetical protein
MNQQSVEDFFRTGRELLSRHRAAFGERLHQFTSDLQDKVCSSQREKKERNLLHAEDFNVFDFIAPDENGLSDIIAWLLDPAGTHGQCEAFLRQFFKVIDLAGPGSPAEAKVYREETTTFLLNPLRRIDILIDFGQFGVGIENKPWAAEQPDQVRDYLTQLTRKYRDNWVLVYLSGDGSPPQSVTAARLCQLEARGQFRLMSFSTDLCTWLQGCREECRAGRVRAFLTDFLGFVGRRFTGEVADWRGA